MGRGHRGALKIAVVAVGGVPAGKDRIPGRAQVHGGCAVVGKDGQIIVAGGGGDGNDVVQVVTGRVNRIRAIVLRRVAGGGHEDDAGLAQAIDGVVQRPRGKARAAPTGVDDFRPFAARVIHALDGIGDEPVSRRVQKFARHDLDLPANADNTDGVVAHRADRPTDVRAVAVIVVWITRMVDDIDAMHIVHVTVAVVVNAITRNLARIDPHVVGQVFVCIAHAGVNDRHDDVARVVLNVPGGLRADVRAGRAPVNARVVQTPKGTVAITKVVGHSQRLHLIIRLGIFHLAAAAVKRDQI